MTDKCCGEEARGSGVDSGSSVDQALPRYQSHKTVWALKIAQCEVSEVDGTALITPVEDGYAPFTVPAEYVSKHQPQEGGYYVVYADGYKSWSPADAFEGGYTRFGLPLKTR